MQFTYKKESKDILNTVKVPVWLPFLPGKVKPTPVIYNVPKTISLLFE